MKVELGNQGLENSWQAPFPGDVECVHCKGIAMPAVSIMEEEHGISDLPTPPPAEGETAPICWPHDATAFTIYLCLGCLKPTALFNQA